MTKKTVVPPGWLEVEFGELFIQPGDDIVDGPFGSNLKATEYTLSGVPIARLQNVDRNRFVLKNIRYVTEKKADELARHTFVPGDILVTKLGDPLGKACLAPSSIERGVLVADVVRARLTHEWVDRRFLCYQINATQMAAQFENQTKGTTRPRVNLTKIRALKARLCPLREQTRIVSRLEELLSDIDAGVEELIAAQKKLIQYRQSLLKAAAEGALTSEWRTQHTPVETGAQLLERILTERRARWEAKQHEKFKEQGKAPPKDWQDKYPEPLAPEAKELPTLPEGWVWASLDMLGEIASGVAKGTKRDADIKLREVPYLRVANVQRGYLDLAEVKTILATEREIEDLTLVAGDVLFNEGGDRDKLGRGWVWRDEVKTCIHQNHVFRMRPYLPELQSELVSHHGNTFGKLWFQTAGKQTTNLASINLTLLRSFPVPVAPADEQAEIVEQVRTQLEGLDRQVAATEFALRQADAQRQSILRAAFAGQLVPQDATDEPASALLERIRASRAKQAKQPWARKGKQHKEIATVARKLIEVLAEADDWVPAQEAFQRCGVADGAETDEVEALYSELRSLDKGGRLAVEVVTDANGRKLYERLKLLEG